MSWLDYSGCTKHGQLVSETQQRISKLQDAIANIQAVRKHLKRNAVEVKAEINSTVSRQLENLRSREVWLLSQVEIVEQAKEEVLRGQQDRLCQMLGGLQTHLEYSTDDPGTSNPQPATLDRKLSSSLEKLDSVDLRPQESPHLSFQADVHGLRETVLKFGHVDGKPRLGKAFASPDTPSTSLPPSWEEYEDGDHHVLYKTLADVSTHNASIQIGIPRKVPNVAGWLSYEPGEEQQEGAADMTAWVSLTGLDEALDTTDCSIKHWLKQIKQHVEAEEEDYDMVPLQHARYVSESSESIELIQSSELNEEADLVNAEMSYPLFGDIMSEAPARWLKSDVTETFTSLPRFDLFDKNHQDPSKWLRKKEEGCCGGQCSPSSVDIENLDTLLCMMTELRKYSQDSKSKDWLVPRTSTDSDKDLDEKQLCMNKVCRANETCSSFRECVYEEGCKQFLTNMQPDTKTWLAGSHNESETLPQFLYYDTIAADDNRNWLTVPATDQTPEASIYLFPEFTRSSSTSSWLSVEVQHNEAPQCYFSRIKNSPSGHLNQWLSDTEIPPHPVECLQFIASKNEKWLSEMGRAEKLPCWVEVCGVNPAIRLPDNPWLHPSRVRHTPPVIWQPVAIDKDLWLLPARLETGDAPHLQKPNELDVKKSVKEMEPEEDDSAWLLRKERRSPGEGQEPTGNYDFTFLLKDIAFVNWLSDPNAKL